MKKLSLKNLNLKQDHLLQREQLKSIFGGLSSVSSGDQDCKVGDNSCDAPNYCIVKNWPYGKCGIVTLEES